MGSKCFLHKIQLSEPFCHGFYFIINSVFILGSKGVSTNESPLKEQAINETLKEAGN